MYRLHGSILAYGGEDARSTADSVITALTPAAWYRNATGVTSAGGFASQWDDYSGNTRHLVQATGTNQPAYAAGVFTLDGADNFMVASTWLQTQPVSLYIVFKQITWTASDALYDGTALNTMLLAQDAATPNLAIYAGASAIASNPDPALDTRVVMCCVYNGANGSVKTNLNAAVTGNAGASSPGGFTLGARATPSNYINAAIEEVVIFGAAHDATTQASVITALNNALTVF